MHDLCMVWIYITVAAAFFQNIRSTLQKHLKGEMSTTAATFVRFGFGIPFALLYFTIFYFYTGEALPAIESHFWFWVCVAALAQIAATFLLLHLFAYRNFAVGTAYSRTEPAQTAIFALVFFGEVLSFGGIIAIAVSIVGVMVISVARTEITLSSVLTSIFSRTALIGLTSGTLFGLAAAGFRAATLAVDHELFFMQAAITLCVGIIFQSVVMFIWIIIKEHGEIANIKRAWKVSAIVGFVGATASFGWFSAFALQQAALVKVVAQIEMLFTFASSVFFFKESINRPEIIGCILITAGIVLLVLL